MLRTSFIGDEHKLAINALQRGSTGKGVGDELVKPWAMSVDDASVEYAQWLQSDVIFTVRIVWTLDLKKLRVDERGAAAYLHGMQSTTIAEPADSTLEHVVP